MMAAKLTQILDGTWVDLEKVELVGVADCFVNLHVNGQFRCVRCDSPQDAILHRDHIVALVNEKRGDKTGTTATAHQKTKQATTVRGGLVQNLTMKQRDAIQTIRYDIRNSYPYSLTFAPTKGMIKEDVVKLEAHLKYHFILWASTWILPRLDQIEGIDKESANDDEQVATAGFCKCGTAVFANNLCTTCGKPSGPGVFGQVRYSSPEVEAAERFRESQSE